MNASPREDDTAGWRAAMLALASVKRYGLESECAEVFDTAVAAGTAPRDAVWYALDEWGCIGADGRVLLIADASTEGWTP